MRLFIGAAAFAVLTLGLFAAAKLGSEHIEEDTYTVLLMFSTFAGILTLSCLLLAFIGIPVRS